MSRDLAARLLALAVVLFCFLRCVAPPSGGASVEGKAVNVPMVSCASNTVLYTTLPIAAVEIAGILPLGNFTTLEHIFPADRVYVAPPVVSGTTVVTNVVAPADVNVVQASRTTWTSPTAFTEYKIWFRPCNEHLSFFDHLGNLDPAFAATLEDFQPGTCTVTTNYTYCLKTVQFGLKAGTLIGQTGSPFGTAMEFGSADTRSPPLAFANPARIANPPIDLYAVCPLDYFDTFNRSALYAKLGSMDGLILRTTTPICGKVVPDIVGTAMGKWFNTTFPDLLEQAHITLGRDPADGTTGVFSIGASLSGTPPNVYSFTPIPPGPAFDNVDFSSVTADGHIYCFDSLTTPGGVSSNELMFIQLIDNTHLKIESSTGASCGGGPHFWDPWAQILQR